MSDVTKLLRMGGQKALDAANEAADEIEWLRNMWHAAQNTIDRLINDNDRLRQLTRHENNK